MMNTNVLPVRLNNSLTLRERSNLRHAWGNAKLVQWLRVRQPFGAETCLCHGLLWDVANLSGYWTCPLVASGDTGELTLRQIRLVRGE